MRNIDFVIANPAGNITAFVLNPVEREDYSQIGKELLFNKEFAIEQVGFVKELSPNPRLEMCGMEFCGNAGRAFGFLCALKANITGHALVNISESGCDYDLLVDVDVANQTSFINMPLPKAAFVLQECDIQELNGATLVDFEGIIHIVLEDTGITPSMELFYRIKDYIIEEYNSNAVGVMFVDSDKSIVPIVYVKDVDSTYEEGSCASGTTACAIAWSMGKGDGDFEYLVKEPAGDLQVFVRVENTAVSKISIGGFVEIGETITMDLDL